MTELRRDPRSFRVLVGPISVIIDDEIAQHLLSGGRCDIPDKAVAHFQVGQTIPPETLTVSAANVWLAREIIEDTQPVVPVVPMTDGAARLVREHGLDPVGVPFDGARLTAGDVHAFLNAQEAPSGDVTGEPDPGAEVTE